jgi:GrpB-like predicted nucleotidyltransferase (UPF0157 family)
MPDKELEKMSLSELGRLFPVKLEEYDPDWPGLYVREKMRITEALGDTVVRINHIGSTSVPGLLAKPTIDILLEVSEGADAEEIVRAFRKMGYLFDPQPGKPPPHMMFMLGYTRNGFCGQAYHVHVRYPGDWDEPYFRDYLRDHPKMAAEYAALKRELKQKYEYDREAYTNGKTEFVKKVTLRARSIYQNRYAKTT